ncbi:prolyl oligopeptidase family serine peptidase [Sphingomonas flavalba]|uniref:S9 family peptidase n=1 Tax=Sphingomonas flavalba TaxID=2559804 RepID=UPI00109DD6B3|nr:S9 family peptidase [Sphingomonas flavalba]
MNRIMLAALCGLALPSAVATARPMTATDLAGLSRIGTATLSPDGRRLVWQQRETDLAANKGVTSLWSLDLTAKGAAPARLATVAGKNAHDPAFSADGAWIYYLTDASGSDQLWRMAAAGGAPEQVTRHAVDLAGFLLSPKGDRVAIWADSSTHCAALPCSAAAKAENGSGRTYDQLFVRHWDTWATPGVRQRVYVQPLAGGPAKAVAGPLIGDSPSKPYGGAEELAWSADGQTLFFTLREAGRIEPLSTNLDIFAAPADGSGGPVNLTEANKAMDSLPAVSPDGQWLAYAAMARPTYEADRLALHLRNLTTGEVRALAPDWDRSVDSIAWAADGRSLLVTAGDHLDSPLFRVSVADGKVTRLTQRGHAAGVLPTPDGGAIVSLDTMTAPADFYRVSAKGQAVRLTDVNAAKLAGIDVPTVQRFTFPGANGDTVSGWLVAPAGATAKLPTVMLVHGGPQGSFADGWSYRWNPMLFAAPGYAVVSIDFHGSTGYGQAFTDSINRDWGGKPLEDLKLGLAAAAAKFPAVDPANACAAGGSYGGYMMNWIAGTWPDQFKCLVVHAGVFDARAMAYETEELWFDEWEHGGPYFEQAAEYEKWNPVNHVTAWKTPMLIIHGEKDFRIPYTQGIAAFTAAQRRAVPSRLVVYPDENHWILKPKNSVQWYGETFDWFAKWLKPAR